jgi:NADPH:quinone reductase and related Zn-dependent oxidoreductases
VPESQLVRKPEGVSFAQAAALPLVSITLWESLYDRARVRRGESVLIHAGAGEPGISAFSWRGSLARASRRPSARMRR